MFEVILKIGDTKVMMSNVVAILVVNDGNKPPYKKISRFVLRSGDSIDAEGPHWTFSKAISNEIE